MKEFWVLGLALLVGFQGGTALYQQGRIGHHLSTVIAWILTFMLLFVLWHTTASVSLQGWWFAAGLILVTKAAMDIHQHQTANRILTATWIEPLEAFGTLFMLMVGTSDLVGIFAGFLAGLVLPFALQDWLNPLAWWSEVLRIVSLGAVGLEDLSRALWPLSMPPIPHVWWMIPWLIWWEISDWLWHDFSTAWPARPRRE
ncbi:hypothetical protein [Sulfobacillus thermosulfidooxidans]|uniref:hypothetical protein n=1 Tax=Sulfobacillus thermosulfidooxidans TaxID=28034 RepID=UPI0006B6739E|nr:hypothetical protein [Sulfobacillus thermosulfidooxidans]